MGADFRPDLHSNGELGDDGAHSGCSGCLQNYYQAGECIRWVEIFIAGVQVYGHSKAHLFLWVFF